MISNLSAGGFDGQFFAVQAAQDKLDARTNIIGLVQHEHLTIEQEEFVSRNTMRSTYFR
jgi:hypothetical protein